MLLLLLAAIVVLVVVVIVVVMYEMVPESICVSPEQTPHWRDVDCQQASWCLGLTHNLGLPIELMDVYMMLVDDFDAIKFL